MPVENLKTKIQRTGAIISRLKKAYPDAHCALDHRTTLQLLVATILSAQCTDVRVNMVTPELFKRFPDAAALAGANIADIEQIIRSTGFFRAKARAIQQTARLLVQNFNGRVPDTMEALTSLRGVGRKTANVVLGNAFSKNVGIVVDTHVGRIARRLGLTRHENPEKVEQDLMKLIPQKEWALFSHLLIFHGRNICFARKPNCDACTLSSLCPSAFKIAK
ncbi:MAG TPA: endonuclease III [Phycisphaerae bacterium]|nr:endonuclease III [Phycisphaerae bacterium]